MRILVAVAPTMYRETLAHIIRSARPNAEVHLADPQALDSEATSFRPHLIVCNDNVPMVWEEVSVFSRVVICYQDNLSASVTIDEQDSHLVQDMAIEDLLGVIDETQRQVT